MRKFGDLTFAQWLRGHEAVVGSWDQNSLPAIEMWRSGKNRYDVVTAYGLRALVHAETFCKLQELSSRLDESDLKHELMDLFTILMNFMSMDHDSYVRQELALKGGKARLKNDPKARAMLEIREAWEVARRSGASFAKEMAMKYQTAGLDLTEGGIKNAITRWRKESSS